MQTKLSSSDNNNGEDLNKYSDDFLNHKSAYESIKNIYQLLATKYDNIEIIKNIEKGKTTVIILSINIDISIRSRKINKKPILNISCNVNEKAFTMSIGVPKYISKERMNMNETNTYELKNFKNIFLNCENYICKYFEAINLKEDLIERIIDNSNKIS